MSQVAVPPATAPDAIGRRLLPVWAQFAAWAAGLAAAWFGLQDSVAEWSPSWATVEGVVLLVGPVLWLLPYSGHGSLLQGDRAPRRWAARDLAACLLVAGLSLALSVATAHRIGDLPPAYHDEYSYLFEAESLRAGRWWWPSSPVYPELFDQMHVLNEGRMASRYYPGTAIWLLPWVMLGHPYWGHWLAGALAAVCVYLTGRELADRRTGLLAGVTFAAAPGLALFGNLLLAHHPTLLGLSLFWWQFLRGLRTGSRMSLFLAGCGLSGAMLCRPATAAGIAFPAGAWFVWRSFRRGSRAAPPPENEVACGVGHWLALGLPLVAGWGFMLTYNHEVTGSWRTSPYQLYTDIYTPRHVFGLNNVVRGEQRLGQKVLEDYDRWAENLTPTKAWENTYNRAVSTWIWLCGVPLGVMTAVLWCCAPGTHGSRWWLIAAGVVSVYAFHWPYWYVGIMGWHYVFEAAPLWCLLLGSLAVRLSDTWLTQRRVLLPVWLATLFVLAWGEMYWKQPELGTGRWQRGCSTIAFPRRQHAQFRNWVAATVGEGPALVLVAPDRSNPHLDFVLNAPGLQARVLFGRLRPGLDLGDVIDSFPDRRVWICQPDLQRLQPAERRVWQPQGAGPR